MSSENELGGTNCVYTFRNNQKTQTWIYSNLICLICTGSLSEAQRGLQMHFTSQGLIY